MPRRGLYAITDAALTPGERLLEQVAAAIDGGVVLVQYRDKGVDAARRRQEAESLLALCRARGVPLLINDDVKLAAAIGANGVHIGQGDAALSEARARLGDEAIIGVTCHDSLALAREAVAGGADYCAFGRFFPSASKPEAPPANPALLGLARAELPCPVVAIGGISADNGGLLIEAGADLLAVIGGLFDADTPDAIRAKAQGLSALFTESM